MSKHKKNVGEYTDMKKLAEDIGDLHYETLEDFMGHLAVKFNKDASADSKRGRKELSIALRRAGHHVSTAWMNIRDAWSISKPFMKE